MEDAVAVFDEWLPWIEATILDVRIEINRFTKPVPRRDPKSSTTRPGFVTFTEPTAVRSAAGATVDWPSGHSEASPIWEKGYGSVKTIVPIPNNGMFNHPPPPVFPRLNPIPQLVQFNPYLHYHPSNPLEPPPNFTLHHLPPNPPAPPPNFIHNQFHPPITFPTLIQPSTALPFQAHQPPQHTPNTSIVTFTNPQPTIPIPTTQYNPTHLGRLPKLHFPKFDGDHTQFWITCASNYFEMYAVESPMWIRVATMHFTGAAKRWL